MSSSAVTSETINRRTPMFGYDASLVTTVEHPPSSIDDVLGAMREIDAVCVDADGLKWFNWLYLQVTEAVKARVDAGGFASASWLAELDVQFARLYFNALESALTDGRCPGCWSVLFASRTDNRLARIQFALAGVNAHINRDLPEALVATCKLTNVVPRHDSPQYVDYTSVNATLDSLIESAKATLAVRLPGDPLAGLSRLEDMIGGWKISAAREAAWNNAEALWNLPPHVAEGLEHAIDGLTTVVGKSLLVPVP